MRRIKKTILSLSLVAAMVMGEAGIALAAEPETAIDNAGYEISDPQLDQATTASINNINVNYYKWSSSINISFSGNGSKFKIYVNNKLFKTVENTNGQASAENPAPAMYYASEAFDDVIDGGSYTIKIVPCSYSASGDVDGTPSESKTVALEQKKISNLQTTIYKSHNEAGYQKAYAHITWTVDSSSYGDYGHYEIWRKEGKAAWKKLGESDSNYYYDYTAVPGKKYQYRVRSAGGKNAYVNVPAGKWLTSKSVKAEVADVYISLDYTDNVSINVRQSYSLSGIVSGYEIWRSTTKKKGYKKIATIAENIYTDKSVKSGTYYYKARAYYYDTATGKKTYGAFSDALPIKLLIGDMNVSAKQSGKGSAKVEWNKVTGAEKYEVWYKSSLSGDAWKLYKTTTGVSCKVSKLSNDTSYNFRVKAIKGNGAGTYVVSHNANCFIGFQSPSAEVVKRKVTASKTKDTVTIKSTIKWDRIYGAKKIRIVGVKSGYDANGNYTTTEKVLKTLKGTATSYTVTTKVTAQNRGYDYIKVVAVKGKEERTGSSSDYKQLNNVKKVTVKRKDDTSATISWKAVPGATNYSVYRISPDGYDSYLGETDGTTYVDSNMTPGVNYTYYVRAYNSKLSLHSSYAPYGPSQDTPRAIYNHKLGSGQITGAKNSAAKKVTLTWSKVNYANTYMVYRSTSKNGKYTKVATTSNTTFTDSKVLKGKTYYYKIKATGRNEAGFAVTSGFSGIKGVKITK